MKIVLFAGGTGKRFWPVSRVNTPKQFSPLIAGKPLLRLSIDRLLKGYKAEDIFISTGLKYKKEVKEIAYDIPEENIILEPEMRDTGPAVTLAVAYVSAKYPKESICIQWSDHLIKDEATFILSLKEAEKFHTDTHKTVFITVPARFPSPHRGYIHYGQTIKNISKKLDVLKFFSFKEKPSIETAESYIADGHYGWNPGYWVINPQYYLKTVKAVDGNTFTICKEVIDTDFSKESCDKFSNLEKISADYLFAENVKAKDAVALLADIGWSDVGEWASLKEALQETEEDNVFRGKIEDLGSSDSIIYNLDDSKLISTIGLKGMVVVNTKDVIAIFPKEENNRLKEFLNKLNDKHKGKYL
jgi:mannose-1-phosphate guanylyltransferase/mannose-6-phosphate isomerase